MRAHEIRRAVLNAGIDRRDFCEAVEKILPVLRNVKARQSWWASRHTRKMINTLAEYRDCHCR